MHEHFRRLKVLPTVGSATNLWCLVDFKNRHLRHPEYVLRAETGGGELLCTLLIPQKKFWNSRDLF